MPNSPKPSRLPEALRTRGWRIWSPDETSAVRLDGVLPAAITAKVHFNFGSWNGYSELIRRTLHYTHPTMEKAIEQLERAEGEGYFSKQWRGGGIVPSRPGWHHRVRSCRDEWVAVTDTPYMVLSVMLIPTPSGAHDVVFAAFVDGMPLTHIFDAGSRVIGVNWDALTIFRDVQDAMLEAEAEAAARHASMGINRPLRLLPAGHLDSEKLIREHA